MQITPDHQRFLVNAARSAIHKTLSGQSQLAVPQTSDPLFLAPLGIFVSLYEKITHRLRGCIGRLQTPDPLIKSVYETAQSTLGDPRFRNNPVTLAELIRLDLEISLLSPLKPVPTPLDFEPQQHGIYLMCQSRTGTFLPQVGKQTGWTREQLLTRLCTEKMGLSADAWKDPTAKLLTYEAFVIGPVPFVEQPVIQAQIPQGTFSVGNTTMII